MKNKKPASRSFSITLVVLLCLFIFATGIAKSYENTVKIGFGEYKNALEIRHGYIRVLDFEIEF